MGHSSDHVPHVGEVPGKPGQFIMGGFTGHGMPVIFLAGRGMADMVAKGVAFEDSGLPRLYKTTKGRLSAESSPLEESLRQLVVTNGKA